MGKIRSFEHFSAFFAWCIQWLQIHVLSHTWVVGPYVAVPVFPRAEALSPSTFFCRAFEGLFVRLYMLPANYQYCEDVE